MAGQHPGRAAGPDHGGGNLAGERAFRGGIHVFGAAGCALDGFHGAAGSFKRGKGHENHDFTTFRSLTVQKSGHCLHGFHGLGAGFVHLPVGSHQLLHNYILSDLKWNGEKVRFSDKNTSPVQLCSTPLLEERGQ